MSVVGDVLNFGLGLANAGYTIYNDQRMIDTQNRWRAEDQAREDATLQRSRADAEKAGYSPLAALSNPVGSSASPVPVGSSDAPFGSAQSALSTAANNKLAREQAAMAKQLTESQIDNTDADTRDKNASADVNEATSAVQILRAKVELDNMIRDGQMSTSQIVGYLNDLKSQGVSDNVIDSLLASFDSEPQNPAAYLSSSDLSGNTLTVETINKLKSDKALTDDYHKLQSTIASEYNLQSNRDLRAALGDAQKLAAEYEAKLKQLDYNNQNAVWTVEVPVMTDSGVARMQKLTGKPYEILHKYSLFFQNYAYAKEDRDWINDPTESNEVVKSIKSFLNIFKDWL